MSPVPHLNGTSLQLTALPPAAMVEKLGYNGEKGVGVGEKDVVPAEVDVVSRRVSFPS